MASVAISGDTSGSITLAAPAVAGSTTQNLVAVSETLAPLVIGTKITLTNQTAPEFTIPSWVKRFTISCSGISASSTGNILVQLGTASSYETSGYLCASSTTQASAASTSNFTSGFGIVSAAAANVLHGAYTFTLIDLSSNTWAATAILGRSDSTATYYLGGSKALSAALTKVRLYIDGTQFFDAGSINILYE